MAPAEKWRVAVGDTQSGPFSFEQLAQMITQGRVPATALVWKEGMDKWRRWTQLPEFTDLVDLATPGPSDVSFGTLVGDVLTFRRMIVPIIIQVVFWIGVFVQIVSGLLLIGLSFREDSLSFALGGIVTMILGPLLVRVLCEFIIVAFRISETLTDIKNQLKRHSENS